MARKRWLMWVPGRGLSLPAWLRMRARFLAFDHSPAMLNVARRNLAGPDADNVELFPADLAMLPLADGSVDAAVANMVLHHAEDPVAMLAEMARVTRRGGWVAIADEVEHRYGWMRDEHADVWLGFSEAQVEGFFGSGWHEDCSRAPAAARSRTGSWLESRFVGRAG